jgi:1-aminocyclopropane-1-carboxylate deaminase/D-cysteine desulfhydrase-like pyridoxal-dependent ACC family enzyme
VPRGGSTPLGAVGFAVAAAELAHQLHEVPPARWHPDSEVSGSTTEPARRLPEFGLTRPVPAPASPAAGAWLAEPLLVVIAVGSGGSYAGLLAGFAAARVPVRVLGVSVSRPPAEITTRVRELAAGCAELIGGPTPLPPEIIDARGPGFGVATERERALARLALHTEALLLDETYGAEAFAVAVDRLLTGGGPVVYWHTGGVLPAIAGITEEGPS